MNSSNDQLYSLKELPNPDIIRISPEVVDAAIDFNISEEKFEQKFPAKEHDIMLNLSN